MIFVLFAFLAIIALALLFSPLIVRARPEVKELALAPYRRQLGELDKELERGVIDREEAAAMRLEIQRRLIREGRETVKKGSGDGAKSREIVASPAPVAGLIILVSAAGLLYAWLGRPDLSGAPAAIAAVTQDRHAEMGDFDEMLSRLRGRLAESPEDLEGWMLLGRSSLSLGRFEEAADAFARAAELNPDDPELYIQQGQALVGLHAGIITPAASLAFERAHKLQPAHPAPHLYRAYRFFQEGDVEAALRIWRRLAAQAPAEAPWLDRIRMEIDRAETILAQREAALAGSPPPGPTAGEVEAAGQMSPSERQAFIESMVARLRSRLEDQPDDLDGWLRLARAEEVLGNLHAAIGALDKAALLAGQAGKEEILNRRARLAEQVAKE